MNSIFKILAITTLTVCGLLLVGVASKATTTLPRDYGCQTGTCQTCETGTSGKRCGACGKRRRPKKCPQCECDFCLLELDCGKEKRTCFKTEQKLICVPPVRLPWKKCCPPGVSKTKTVKVLKTHTYECPSCSYKWTVQEPNVFGASTQSDTPTKAKPDTKDSAEPPLDPEKATPPQPPFEGATPKVSLKF